MMAACLSVPTGGWARHRTDDSVLYAMGYVIEKDHTNDDKISCGTKTDDTMVVLLSICSWCAVEDRRT